MSVDQIKTAIEQLSFEERAELAAWLHGWKDDEWDEQMKKDVESPEWHGEVLAARKAKVESGEAQFLSVAQLKKRLRR